ncbi:N-acetylmuramoyl-L-alanine amidase [Haliangium ochraceum]|uniref:N-acetylmuramoyl-L-alanine amidase n=1 Tax=Haliangium ochraceum (strain DSM 14365 / JCM 11303 / SMP-2) TaxID=502025 RepID=D0LH65_HALO1|nr:N-acetylmuramoyl-L-alanine amidase [Haliangium ochraceum]ACY18210.1 N-acetylmuramyl-L-alanine amidase, negative regulator of AmpC, AmpD [Haliangium ochraceum DSM 14365]
MGADDYNQRALAAGRLRTAHLTALTRRFQDQHGLVADGKCGPLTRAVLEREAFALEMAGGWLSGPGVVHLRAHASWFGAAMPAGPLAIMAHYTATDPGTARAMAERRVRERTSQNRPASWHITIDHEGTIWQMVAASACAWHCARGKVDGPSGKKLSINQAVVGIELEGHGEEFTAAQIEAACRVWRALVRTYAIPDHLAMLEHSRYDPGRRVDPGPVWMKQHAQRVLAFAFG